MARYYEDEYEYSPERRLIGSSISGLSNVLGGYLGAKLEQGKRAREARSVAALAKSQGIDINDPNFHQMDPRERRSFLEYNRLQTASTSKQEQRQQQEQADMQSVLQYAQANGVDPNLLQNLNSKDARAFVDKAVAKRVRQEKRQQKQADKAFNEYLTDIREVGGTYDDAIKFQGIFTPKQFKRFKESKDLPTEVLKLRNDKKRYIKGKMTPVELAQLEGTVDGDILIGKPITRDPKDPIVARIKQIATDSARQNIKFNTWDLEKQMYRVTKLSYKIAEGLGYILQKQSRQDIARSIRRQMQQQVALQEQQLLQAQQPGLLSRAGSAISGLASGYQPMEVRSQQEQQSPMGQLEGIILRSILGR